MARKRISLLGEFGSSRPSILRGPPILPRGSQGRYPDDLNEEDGRKGFIITIIDVLYLQNSVMYNPIGFLGI
jgi:hypothetical protein